MMKVAVADGVDSGGQKNWCISRPVGFGYSLVLSLLQPAIAFAQATPAQATPAQATPAQATPAQSATSVDSVSSSDSDVTNAPPAIPATIPAAIAPTSTPIDVTVPKPANVSTDDRLGPSYVPGAPLSSSVAVSPLPQSASSSGCQCHCDDARHSAVEPQGDPYRRLAGYGWQIALGDATNLAVHLIAVAATEQNFFDGPMPYTFFGTYLAVGPLIHVAHGRTNRAGHSLGLRATTPIALGLLGMLISPNHAPWFGAAGMVGSAAVDAISFGRGDYAGMSMDNQGRAIYPWIQRETRTAGVRMAWSF
ncbi:MAG: hypothetical protein QM784_11425 [Polyangiaceae bacterium]